MSEEKYAAVEKYIALYGPAASDLDRARAHLIVVAFLMPEHHRPLLMLEPHTDVDLRTGELRTMVPRIVKASMERLGYRVIVDMGQPAHMDATKEAR